MPHFIIVQCELEECENRFNKSALKVHSLNKSKLNVRYADRYLILSSTLLTGLRFITVKN